RHHQREADRGGTERACAVAPAAIRDHRGHEPQPDQARLVLLETGEADRDAEQPAVSAPAPEREHPHQRDERDRAHLGERARRPGHERGIECGEQAGDAGDVAATGEALRDEQRERGHAQPEQERDELRREPEVGDHGAQRGDGVGLERVPQRLRPRERGGRDPEVIEGVGDEAVPCAQVPRHLHVGDGVAIRAADRGHREIEHACDRTQQRHPPRRPGRRDAFETVEQGGGTPWHLLNIAATVTVEGVLGARASAVARHCLGGNRGITSPASAGRVRRGDVPRPVPRASFRSTTMPRVPLLLIPAVLAAALASAQAAPLTLERIMADADWIGPPVERPYWSLDGGSVIYSLKRTGSPVRDLWRVPAGGGAPRRVAPAELATLDATAPVFDRERRRAAFVRNGDVFVRDLKSRQLVQVTRTPGFENAPQFSADGRTLQFRGGTDWLGYDLGSGVTGPLALVVPGKDPDEKKPGDLERMQLRLITTLRKDRADRDSLKREAERLRSADPTRSPLPVYLGDDVKLDRSVLSPAGRWLLAVTTPKSYDEGRAGKMPVYVTES